MANEQRPQQRPSFQQPQQRPHPTTVPHPASVPDINTDISAGTPATPVSVATQAPTLTYDEVENTPEYQNSVPDGKPFEPSHYQYINTVADFTQENGVERLKKTMMSLFTEIGNGTTTALAAKRELNRELREFTTKQKQDLRDDMTHTEGLGNRLANQLTDLASEIQMALL